MKRIIIFVIGLLILAGVIYFANKSNSKPPVTNTVTNQPVEIVVNYQKDQAFAAKSYTINQGQEVVIKVTSDVAGELHFHGYDLHTDLQPGKEGSISFTANNTGRFEFELESRSTTLGVIEVQPK